LELLSGLYDLSLDTDDVRQEMDRQHAALDKTVEQDPRMKNWVRELEALYDSETAARADEGTSKLSPELEQFLQEIERRWNEPEGK
jgi:SHS2 domain-containing protein